MRGEDGRDDGVREEKLKGRQHQLDDEDGRMLLLFLSQSLSLSLSLLFCVPILIGGTEEVF